MYGNCVKRLGSWSRPKLGLGSESQLCQILGSGSKFNAFASTTLVTSANFCFKYARTSASTMVLPGCIRFLVGIAPLLDAVDGGGGSRGPRQSPPLIQHLVHRHRVRRLLQVGTASWQQNSYLPADDKWKKGESFSMTQTPFHNNINQCCGSGSTGSVSFPRIRISIKN